MNDSGALPPEVMPFMNLSLDIGNDFSDSSTQTNEFDSGHVTWLLACTAVTWLMVSSIYNFCS